MYLWKEKKKILEFLKKLKIRCFSKTKEIPGISHRRHNTNSGNFLKEKSERNVWESVLAKNPGFFEPFATARFYNSKGKRRCADCRFVTDAVRAQISIKKSRIFMRNGKGKPPMEIPHTIFAIRRYRFYGIIYTTSIKRKRGEKDNCPKLNSWLSDKIQILFFDFGKMSFFFKKRAHKACWLVHMPVKFQDLESSSVSAASLVMSFAPR